MPPKKSQKSVSSSPRGRGGYIGGMVNSIIAGIIQNFLLLSPATQRELVQRLQGLIQNSEPVRAESSTVAVEDRPGVPDTAPPKTEKRTEPKSARSRSWDWPIIKDLEAAKRQSKRSRPDRDSPEGRGDGRILSAAIAALARARRKGISLTDVARDLIDRQHDVSALGLLYQDPVNQEPPGETQEEEKPPAVADVVMEAGPKEPAPVEQPAASEISPTVEVPPDARVTFLRSVLRARIGTVLDRSSDSTFVTRRIINTTVLAGAPALLDIPEADVTPLLGPDVAQAAVPLHNLATLFMRSQVIDRNYRSLRQYMRYRSSDGAVVLLDVPRRWGDQSDTESDGGDKVPPRKGRKRRKTKSK